VDQETEDTPPPVPKQKQERELPWSKFDPDEKRQSRPRLLSKEIARVREVEVKDKSKQDTLFGLKNKSPVKYAMLEKLQSVPKSIFKQVLVTPEPNPMTDIFEHRRTTTTESLTTLKPEHMEIPPTPSLSAIKAIAKDLGEIYETFIQRALKEIDDRVQTVVQDHSVTNVIKEAIEVRMEKTLLFRQKLLAIQQFE
jgi:hypothetical protein